MRTSLRLALAASLVCAALCPMPGRAQTEIPTQAAQPNLVKLLPPDTKTFTLAVALGSPPDDFRDAKGEVAGWEIDIMRAATEALGLTLEFRPTTFDTLIPGLQAKRFDGATGQMGITEAREKVLDMVGTLIGNELFAALSDKDIKVNSLDDLCGVTVGTTRGSREMVFVEDHQPKCAAAGKKPINALAFSDGNGAVEALMSRGRTCSGWARRRSATSWRSRKDGPRSSAAIPIAAISGSACRRARRWCSRCRRRCSTSSTMAPTARS